MKSWWRSSLSVIVSLFVCTGCAFTHSANKAEQTELIVSAAASLQNGLTEFADLYENLHPDIKLTFNFAASGALQQQIEQGAPTDIFISAGQKQMDALLSKHLIMDNKSVPLLANSLVMIVPRDSKLTVKDAFDLSQNDLHKISLGDIDAVPAGAYTKEALTYFKLWDALQPKLIFAKDVRQVLTYVESGNVDAGFVYHTDALTSNKVKVAFTIDKASHKAITYPAAVVKATKSQPEAAQLLSALQSEEAAHIFIKYGFTKPGE